MGRRRARAELHALHRKVWGDAYYEQYSLGARRPRRFRPVGIAVIVCGAMVVVMGVASPGAHATPPRPEHKITLCHRTDSYTNPYVSITVDVASVLHHGHDGHGGPVFFAGIPKHQKWGDIIPPFNFGSGEIYGGKNWTSDGTVVFNRGCATAATVTTTSVPTVTTKPVATTTTAAPPTSTTTMPTSTSSPPTSNPTNTTLAPSSTTAPANTASTIHTPSSSTTTAPGTVTTAGGEVSTIVVAAMTSPANAGTAGSTSSPGQSGPLPRTGSNAFALILIGLGIIGAGIGLTRRHRVA
jgi:LPXTG-motif cell wall-anchored protein